MKSITWTGESKRFNVTIFSPTTVSFSITQKDDGEGIASVNLKADDLRGVIDVLSDAAYELENFREVENG